MGSFHIKEQRMTHDAARAFAVERLASNATQWNRDGAPPDEVVREMGEPDLLGIIVPVEWSGSYTDYVAHVLVLKEVAAGCAADATVMNVHNSVDYGPILKFGTEVQKARYLPDLVTGRVIGALRLTEPRADSEADNLCTRAVLRDGKWVLTGNKQFVINDVHANIAIVFAVTDPDTGKRGISAFIVLTDASGFHVGRLEHKLDIRALDAYPIILEDYAVPKENPLGERGEGLKIALSDLEDGRIGIAVQVMGIARAAFDVARSYANECIRFGKALHERQTIADVLVGMVTRPNAARLLVHRAARPHSADKPYLSGASQAKLYALELAEEICPNTIQIHEGHGYLANYAVERHYRDACIAQIHEGTSEVQRMVIARHV